VNINVLDYFEQSSLERCPHKVAIVSQKQRLTFRDLERRAKACALEVFRRIDMRSRPVAVFLPKCAETIVADLGIVYSERSNAFRLMETMPDNLPTAPSAISRADEPRERHATQRP